MKQKLLFSFVLLIYTNILFSQKYNSLVIGIGTMTFTNSKYPKDITQQGIYYERKINKKISLQFLFFEWINNNNSINSSLIYEPKCYSNCWYSSNLKECEHKLTVRQNYKMVDFTFLYSLYSRKKTGNLSIGSGISYAWGNNVYIDSVITSNIAPYDNIVYNWRHENGKYIGIVPVVDYSYNFWKNRLSIGTSFKARKYFGLKDTQFDWIFHVGYNF